VNAPEISVVIPNYNRCESLHKAVESVLAQQGVSFELLVVDDASEQPPEAVYERVQEAGHRVLRSPRREGPGPARNRGALEARGRYLAMLDSDDYWLPGKLERQWQSLRASGHRISQVVELWYRNGVPVQPPPQYRIEGGDLFARSLRFICVSPSSVMLERELFLQHGGFDPELFVCEDYDLWLRVAAQERFDVVHEPLVVKYGGHADQLSKAMPAMDRFRLLALARGLRAAAYGERWPAAREELLRKAVILEKGSRKRCLETAVRLCQELRESARRERWEETEQLARELVAQWPRRPEELTQGPP
jgi:glycosyltransferase involved in cell wall biosynthesis